MGGKEKTEKKKVEGKVTKSRSDDDAAVATTVEGDSYSSNVDGNKQDEDDEQQEEQLVCCCLCYTAVDYSDKSYFCQEARDADSDLEGEQPKLLPIELYDANNALVYCDSCDRPFHQRCHFVPIIHLPRGDWHCLICSSAKKLLETKEFTKQQLNNDNLYAMKKSNSNANANANDASGTDHADATLEVKWEFAVRNYKVSSFKAEMRRVKSGLSQQFQSIRLAQMALNAFTTSRRKTSTAAMLKSQELCQTLVKLTAAKLKVRQLLCSLEAYRRGNDREWNILQEFLTQNPSERKAWFPFGDRGRRQVPRLREYDQQQEETNDEHIPAQVHIGDAPARAKHGKASSKTAPTGKTVTGNDDDDSGISLDDLKCCVCFKGDATDDNDLLLCDGHGCFRAHHYQCLSPHMTEEKAEAEEDWFCPICTAIAKLVAEVQSEYTGDEWVTEDHESIESWDNVKDVFPEAEKEYELARKWKANKVDEETSDYLKGLFGDDNHNHYDDDSDNAIPDDDDDEDEDDDFDPTAKKEDDDDVGSDTSSRASKLDMSDVELNISRKELEQLSGGEEDSDDEESGAAEEKTAKRRRSRRRVRSAWSSRASTDNESMSDNNGTLDVGQFSERNIVHGKRKRRKIDYRLLNDSMFGKLSAKDKQAIDDQDDFQYKEPKRKDTSSDSSDHDDNDEEDDAVDSSDDDDDNTHGENEGITSKDDSESEDVASSSSPPPPPKKKKQVPSSSSSRKKKVATKRKRVPPAKKDQRRLAARRQKK